MALRLGFLKSSAAGGNNATALGFMRWAHVASISAPLDTSINFKSSSPPPVLPESDQTPDNLDTENGRIGLEFGFPGLPFGGSMELMAVPKKKVSRHKRGIRNGPKALKPTPVIIRCRSCGRVKLPHFYCCSGERGNTGEKEN